MLNAEQYIILPASKARDAVKLAFDMSLPDGLVGELLKDSVLTNDEVDKFFKNNSEDGLVLARMDYVHARSCKFTLYKHPADVNLMMLDLFWYDHYIDDYENLLRKLGISDPKSAIEAAEIARKKIE